MGTNPKDILDQNKSTLGLQSFYSQKIPPISTGITLPRNASQDLKLNSRKQIGIIETSNTFSNTRSGMYICIGGKKRGVEAGFNAIEYDQEFIDAFEKNIAINKKTFAPVNPEFYHKIQDILRNNNLSLVAEQSAQIILDEIMKNTQALNELSEFIQENNFNEKIINPPFSIWMFKQDYEIKGKNEVYIPKIRAEGLKRDDIRGSTNRVKENINALRECMANDIAIASGYNTQQQRLMQSTYPNGEIKFMTACKLAPGFKEIGEEYSIRGDIYDPKEKKGLFENYLTSKKDDHKAITHSVNVPLMGTLSAYSAFAQDTDFMGAYGQNKGIKNHKPFIIDLGKAFRPNTLTEIISTLQDNGQFSQFMENVAIDPIRRHVIYRNNSILQDTPFIETMIGYHMLNKMVNNVEPRREIAESYNVALRQIILDYIARMKTEGVTVQWNEQELQNPFDAIMAKVEGGSLNKIFAQYEAAVKSLDHPDRSPDEKKEIAEYLTEVTKAKEIANQSAKKILTVFNNRLQLTANQVEILSNLEKLTSPVVKDLSSDQKVVLSHLQVDRKSRLPWAFKQLQGETGTAIGSAWLECDLSKNPDFNYSSNKTQVLENAKAEMIKFLKAQHVSKFIIADISNGFIYENKLVIAVSKEAITALNKALNEKNVHEYRIPLSSAGKTLEIVGKTFFDYTEQKRTHSFRGRLFKDNFVGPLRLTHYKSILFRETQGNTALQLMTLIGFLNSGSKDLKKELVATLNMGKDAEMTKKRLTILITEELLKINPDLQESKINDLITKYEKLFKELNTLIEAKQPVDASKKQDEIAETMQTDINSSFSSSYVNDTTPQETVSNRPGPT